MKAVFVDTGGWMACADQADPAHAACTAARDATLEAGRTLVTTDFVVDETLARSFRQALSSDIYAGGRRGRLDVCECRIVQLPSAPLTRTSVSSPTESICRSPILALIAYSDVTYAV